MQNESVIDSNKEIIDNFKQAIKDSLVLEF
jgi:hypothetical protein